MPRTLPQCQKGPVAASTASRSRRPVFAGLAAFSFFFCLVFVLSLRRSEFIQVKWKAAEETLKPTEPTPLTVEQSGPGQRPSFSDIIQLMDLPSTYLPETGKHRHSGRLVVVGDVHGMKDELQALLDKVKFNKKHDHLILAGDMISKGPDSPGVVDLAMSLGATAVRGNHEDRVILADAEMKHKYMGTGSPDISEDEDKEQDEVEEERSGHGDDNDRALVKALGHKRMKWLKNCPVILRVGKLGSLGEVVVVHAGLAPGVKLEKQDPVMVMNMRTIDKGGVPSDGRNGIGWIKVWNKYQKTLPKHDRTTVIYGHDSKKGLQIKKYSMGVDTSCLKGGKLTAVVIEGGQSDHTHKLVHVNCKDGRGK
ncbi:putative ser/Thr protein phosphatase family [Diplocarpon rosae]|nr:putative ser/Thr protein phosphatase family [Diplocarpon rosae]